MTLGTDSASAAAFPTTPEALVVWLVERLATELRRPAAEFDPEAPIGSYGVDSVVMAGLVAELEEGLGRELSPTLFWDYPTLAALAQSLMVPPGFPPTPGGAHGRGASL